MKLFAPLFIALFLSTPTIAAPVIWRIDHDSSRMYLAGSVHALRAQDHPLHPAYLNVYRDADMLLMEMDADDLNPPDASQTAILLAVDGKGPSLNDVLTKKEQAIFLNQYPIVAHLIEFHPNAEPWLLGISAAQMHFQSLGFSITHGVESHFSKLAINDKKPLYGLETRTEQMTIFDELSRESQRDILLSLLDTDTANELLVTLIATWKQGDVKTLASLATEQYDVDAGLYQTLLIERNKRWLPMLENTLSQPDTTTMVIVGAMHLVGPESVVELLQHKGYNVNRLVDKVVFTTPP